MLDLISEAETSSCFVAKQSPLNTLLTFHLNKSLCEQRQTIHISIRFITSNHVFEQDKRFASHAETQGLAE